LLPVIRLMQWLYTQRAEKRDASVCGSEVNVWDAEAWCKIQDCTCHSTLSLQAHAEQVKGESIPASSDGLAGTLDGAFPAFSAVWFV
jgi:hypothetical protein